VLISDLQPMDYDKALCVYSFVRMITETFEDDLEIFSARLKAYLEHPGHARRKAPGRVKFLTFISSLTPLT